MALLSIRKKTRKNILEKIKPQEIDFGEKPPYLMEYLEKTREKIGEPMIVDRLSGEMKKWRTFNVLYPIGNGIFIHAYTPKAGEGLSGYNKYIIIEPPKPHSKLMRLIEESLAIKITSELTPRSSEEKKAILLYLLDQILQPTENIDYEKISIKRGKIPVKKSDIGYVKYHTIREKVGVGILEPFLRDPYIEDISCSGIGNIFIVHKMFGPMESNMGFKNEDELDTYIIKLGEKIGKPISTSRPVVDASLPDGSRINIVYGTDVSLRGSNFTIRRVAKTPISVTQLISWGTFDARIAAYIWMMLSEGMSMFVCGETASGKTTSLNAISVFIKPTAKIVTIEDTAEVVLPHPNWTRELTRDTGKPESSVTMFDLLKAALRQRPNYIIVGEIRGAEGNIAFQAMQSVTGDTPILVRKHRQKPMLIPIKKLVDRYYRENEERTPKKITGYYTLTLDKRGRVKWAPIKYVLRHKANKIYKIYYNENKTLKTTGSHSVFILDLDKLEIVPKPVSKLRTGDLLVGIKRKQRILQTVPTVKPIIGILEKTLSLSTNIAFNTLNISYNTAKQWNKNLNPTDNDSRKIPFQIIEETIKRTQDKFPGSMRYIKHRYQNGKQTYITSETAKKILDILYNNTFKQENRLVYHRLKTIIESDIEFYPIEKIVTTEYNDYVYDLSVPETELFIGGETPVALHNTGHPVMSTFHAADLERLIQRLTNNPINVPKTNLDSLNLAWFQSAVYVKGFPARRVIAINELMGYDPKADAIAAMPVFTWDPIQDRFIFGGRGASYLLEEKIAVMRALPRSRINEIYEELEIRRRYMQLLVDKKIFDYDKVFKAVIHADRVGIEKALQQLERGTISF